MRSLNENRDRSGTRDYQATPTFRSSTWREQDVRRTVASSTRNIQQLEIRTRWAIPAVLNGEILAERAEIADNGAQQLPNPIVLALWELAVGNLPGRVSGDVALVLRKGSPQRREPLRATDQ